MENSFDETFLFLFFIKIMRKRCSSTSPDQNGIVCSDDDLGQILAGGNLRPTNFAKVSIQGNRRKTFEEAHSNRGNFYKFKRFDMKKKKIEIF